MSKKRNFDENYTAEIKEIPLPPKLAGIYWVVDCLKESEEKKIYRLADQSEGLFMPVVIDYWQDDQSVYIFREYVEGMTLPELYDKGQIENEVQVIGISLQICKQIGVLHRKNPPVIHRDIKPENFIWNRDKNRLYLIDCDSARIYKEGRERDTIVLGTPTHAAPEAYGYTQCDVRSDVFGIGKTIQYLCCGRSDDDALEKCEIPKNRNFVRYC